MAINLHIADISPNEQDRQYAQDQVAKHKAIRAAMKAGTYHDVSLDYDESDAPKRLSPTQIRKKKNYSVTNGQRVKTFCGKCYQTIYATRATIRTCDRLNRPVTCTTCLGKNWSANK